MADRDDLHFEPFLHLAGLTHDDVLIAWGGFWFERPAGDGGSWRIVEDPQFSSVASIDRHHSIGLSSEPYGAALVEVFEVDSGRRAAQATTDDANHVWLRGLQPDTHYRYRVVLDGEPWGEGTILDGEPDGSGGMRLVDRGRRYDNRFRTFPAPDQRQPLTFAVIGDYGIGMLAEGGAGERQLRVARSVERAVDMAGVRLVVTTGDNIYLGAHDTPAGSGEHDDDWYFSFYEPYRHVINRVPVYPSVGNHDASDTERSDDRDQLADNMFTDLRFSAEAEVGRASVDPGLFYRFDYGADVEFVCIDTTLASGLEFDQFFQAPEHRSFLEEAFPSAGHTEGEAHPRWRVPFCHHPPLCAGPSHPNMQPMIDDLVPLFERSGVRLVLAGHEHNFQLNERDGITYAVTGAGGKLREERPTRFDEAGTQAWAAEAHFLLVCLDPGEATIRVVREIDDGGTLHDVGLQTPGGDHFPGPITIARSAGHLAGEAPRRP